MNKFYRFCAFRRTYFKAKFIFIRVLLGKRRRCKESSCNIAYFSCLSRVAAPARFGVMSTFTKKDTFFTRKTGRETRFLYFSFTLKTLQEFFFFLRKRLKSSFLKKQWHRVVGEVKHENLVSHNLISGSNFPASVSPSSESCVCSYRGRTSCAIGGKVREGSLESG